MIEFNLETDFDLKKQDHLKQWISKTITSEGFDVGEIVYVFCDDTFLNKLNIEFLNHDTLTDILSFDYKVGKQINGEIYISVERVLDNANDFKTNFEDELHRVMIHGILHFCGYKDKGKNNKIIMREKEDDALQKLSKL